MLRPVNTIEDFGRAVAELSRLELGYTIAVGREKSRSLDQNALLHKWFAEIAKQRGDVTAAEVKAECNLTYGRPILDRDDPEWKSAFGYLFDSLNHGAKLKAIRVLDVPFTRRMTKKQLAEYMDQLARDARDAGWQLTQPEET